MAGPVVTVSGKMSSLLECVHRPLRQDERPKRKGQTTVYEATGNLTDDAFKLWEKSGPSGPLTVRATIKHDGQCARVKVDRSTNPPSIAFYRRLDVKEGGSVPGNAVKLPTSEDIFHTAANEDHNIHWIRVDGSNRADNQYFESTFIRDTSNRIVRLAFIHPKGQHHEFTQIPIESLPDDVTVELVGPKVQSDPYEISKTPHSSPVDLLVGDKIRKVPRHWLILHGAFTMPIPTSWWTPRPSLDLVRDFILDRKIEGLVFQFRNAKGDLEAMLKVNRGHIGVPHEGVHALALSELGEAKVEAPIEEKR